MARPRPLTLLRYAVTLAVLGWCGLQIARSWAAIQDVDLVFQPVTLGLSVLLCAASLLGLGALSWAGLRLSQAAAAGLVVWVRVWLQSYLYRYVPGKVMLLVERARLGARFGLASATSVVLAVWESQLVIAGAGLLSGAALLSRPAQPGDPVSGPAVTGLALLTLLGSLLLWPALRVLARRLPALHARIPGLVLSVPVTGQLALALGYAAVWAALGLSFSVCASALSPGLTPDTGLMVVWFVTSYVGGQVSSVTPAGLGVREGLLVAGLGAVAPPELVLAWAVAHRILLSATELILLALAQMIRLPAGPPTAAG